jgi:hypothetical protein
MKCEKIIINYLEQEDCRYPSLMARFHMILCSSCREEIHKLRDNFIDARMSSPYTMPVNLVDSIMRKIYNSGHVSENDIIAEENISPSKWFYSGVILFASIILLSYSDSLTWLKGYFGSALEIPLNIVLGLIITVYAASYIGTHLDGVKKFAEFINSKIN